jgi:hypothetical protein
MFTPKIKAITITALSTIAGIIGIVVVPIDWATCWPVVLLYAVLLINTYFSVSHFSKIIPANVFPQKMIDAALVVFYLVLAATLDDPMLFMFALTVFFAIATFKYTSALPLVAEPARLYRKIKVDALGTIGSAFTLCGVLFVSLSVATALWTIVFGVASIYLLFVNPLYADDRRS